MQGTNRGGVVITVLVLVYCVTMVFAQPAQAPASPTGVRVVKDTSAESRMRGLCAELMRNDRAGILFLIPAEARPDDRICVQKNDRETLLCHTVNELRAAWLAEAEPAFRILK